MNTYTSTSTYTSPLQSVALGKFLPLESADMYYHTYPSYECWHGVPNIGKADLKDDQMSCWSLAALLNVLPKNLNIGRPSLESNYEGYYWIQYYDEFMKPNNYKTKCYDNPINACYEMILKLHELKML